MMVIDASDRNTSCLPMLHFAKIVLIQVFSVSLPFVVFNRADGTGRQEITCPVQNPKTCRRVETHAKIERRQFDPASAKGEKHFPPINGEKSVQKCCSLANPKNLEQMKDTCRKCATSSIWSKGVGE
jgi:hypothetical protein